MPHRHDCLFAAIASFPALREAAVKAARGKRHKPACATFLAGLEGEVLKLERELKANRYRPGGYVTIEVKEPKHRVVSAAPFRDRVVHHALCRVIEPIFDQGFIDNSFANRIGKGTHRAVETYERYCDRHAYVLRCDIYRFFPSIDHLVLKALFRRRVTCQKTLQLMDLIVDRSNAQEPVELFFPGDDLFAPMSRRRGLPIGNLSSQFFANLYLDGLDHFVTEVLHAPYLRYVDDFALFDDDPIVLAEWKHRIEQYLEGRRLKVHPQKTRVQATAERTVFLGYELSSDGRRRLPEDSVARFRHRLRGLRDRWRAGKISMKEVECRINAWIGHASFADTWRLRHAIFAGGLFDPSAKPEQPRVLRAGSWNNKPRNLRAANRNRNTPDNRNDNNGFRVASTLTPPEPVRSRSCRVGT